MCYNLVSATRKKLAYAIATGADPAVIEKLMKKLEELLKKVKAHYFVNAFQHPHLLVYASGEIQSCRWGLIPHWVKDEETASEIQNQTLNARGETIFEKPAFRSAAEKGRCLVLADAFYEYHHRGKLTFPYHISFRDGGVMPLAGIRDEWVNPSTGEIVSGVSIVTTEANALLSHIHNNPKAEGPRMPLILEGEARTAWLDPSSSRSDLLELIRPFDENRMQAYTVARQKGAGSPGDSPDAEKEFLYSELTDLFS